MMKRTLWLAALALSFGTEASGAEPATECLWATIPPATRDRMFVAYAAGGGAALDAAYSGPSAKDAFPCVGTPANRAEADVLAEQVAQLMIVLPLERASQQYLSEQGYDERTLNRAWDGLGPRDRSTLRSTAQAIIGRGTVNPTDIANVIVRAADLAGRPANLGSRDEPSLERFVDYFTSRAAREAFEAETN